MPRFAVLAHDHPSPHWDLFLEAGPVLRSWRLLAPLAAGAEIPAEPTPDHRLLYLDYEGPVSAGRGTVSRVDGGTFDWQLDLPDHVAVRLTGTGLSGLLTLRRSPAGWSARLDAP
jgi:DNA polymerase ligase (LigD)-like protein